MGGANYVCSGNSVASDNKSTVSTAGHCLNEGPGAFATNFIFVPAYLNGAAPYGKWAAKGLYTPTQWSSAGNMQYDTGFAVMNQLNGQNLADVVGASGVQFNAARGLSLQVLRLPRGRPVQRRIPEELHRARPPTIPTTRSSRPRASRAT